jgi:hypothetical protein
VSHHLHRGGTSNARALQVSHGGAAEVVRDASPARGANTFRFSQ